VDFITAIAGLNGFGTHKGCGTLRDCRYLLHDRDTKYTQSFRAIIVSGRVEPLVVPARSPNLNGFAERLIGSIRRECLDHIIVLGEVHLRRILKSYADYYNGVRTHR
jgi:putative transposase